MHVTRSSWMCDEVSLDLSYDHFAYVTRWVFTARRGQAAAFATFTNFGSNFLVCSALLPSQSTFEQRWQHWDFCCNFWLGHACTKHKHARLHPPVFAVASGHCRDYYMHKVFYVVVNHLIVHAVSHVDLMFVCCLVINFVKAITCVSWPD